MKTEYSPRIQIGVAFKLFVIENTSPLRHKIPSSMFDFEVKLARVSEQKIRVMAYYNNTNPLTETDLLEMFNDVKTLNEAFVGVDFDFAVSRILDNWNS
jgi:hypothetical protein